MYLYVLTYWCQKIMHQNVTLTHNYKEKDFSFSSITSIEKTMYRKKGHGDEKKKLSHTIQSTWFMRCLQIKTLTVKLSSFTRLRTALPLRKKKITFHSPALVFSIFLFIASSHHEKEKHSASNTDAVKGDSSICG